MRCCLLFFPLFWAIIYPLFNHSESVLFSGLDLFAYDSDSKSLRLVETKKLNVSWYVYTHESRLVLLASGMQCKTFTGFQVPLTAPWLAETSFNLDGVFHLGIIG